MVLSCRVVTNMPPTSVGGNSRSCTSHNLPSPRLSRGTVKHGEELTVVVRSDSDENSLTRPSLPPARVVLMTSLSHPPLTWQT